jgi:serine/threonine protein kinase
MGEVYSLDINGKTNIVVKISKTPPLKQLEKCLTKRLHRYDYRDSDRKGKIIIPPGSYLCMDERYSEYMLGLLVSNTTPNLNYVRIMGFATCYKPELRQYTFMEKISMSLIDAVSDDLVTENDMVSILLQLILSLKYLQTNMIMHNDLHVGNIFLDEIDKDTVYDGVHLNQIDYICYNRNLYVPKGKYIVKLGDWGFGCKYGNRMILNKSVMEGSTKIPLPNWFFPLYDLVFSLCDIYVHTEDRSPLLKSLMNYVTDSDWSRPGTKKKLIMGQYKGMNLNTRPKLEYLYENQTRYKSVDDLLGNSDSPIYGYTHKPNTSRILYV